MSQPSSKVPREVFLTPNQREIVQRLLGGNSAAEIARTKRRSVDTIRQTIRAIYSRFNVCNLSELKAGITAEIFNIRVGDGNGREHTLRSGLAAIQSGLDTMRRQNVRKGTRRRRMPISLHESEMEAILNACHPFVAARSVTVPIPIDDATLD